MVQMSRHAHTVLNDLFAVSSAGHAAPHPSARQRAGLTEQTSSSPKRARFKDAALDVALDAALGAALGEASGGAWGEALDAV